jgi:dephospho-CoA kinase
MLIIGITGGTGAGKTSALRAIESLGALALDCDEIYHELLSSDATMKSELESRFPGVIRDGLVNRKYLADIVFNDSLALSDLNDITHKYIAAAVAEKIAQWEAKGGGVVAIDAIALFESGVSDICNVIVGITALKETRITRIMLRDSSTREQAEMRINAQKPDEFYVENSDYILENYFADSEEFTNYCTEFFAKIMSNGKNAYNSD